MNKDEPPVIIEQNFNISAEKIWAAITEIDQMREWFFEQIPEFKPKIGFKTQFNVLSDEREFIHLWQIVEVTPLEMIKYNWRYRDYPGNSYVTFQLSKDGDMVKLQVTHEVTEDFQNDIPEFKRESCQAGWEYFISKNLKNYLSSIK